MEFMYKIGETNTNTQGLNMTIIRYKNASEIDVQFDDGFISNNKQYYAFQNGKIKNPYAPSVYGIGYIGEGKYRSTINGKQTIQYKMWQRMLERCYDEKYHKNKPTYKECTVCDEWLCLQNHGVWFDENYYTVSDQVMCLDKDILSKGNKIYSPETCVFIPNKINTLFIKCDSVRGEYPVGVCYSKKYKKYQSQLSENEKIIHLGLFDTPLQAFEAYKTEKEKHIKEVADEYKGIIPNKVYEAMYRYEVDME